jgi:hypothetical protein
MPDFQDFLGQLNYQFSSQNIGDVQAESFGSSLTEATQALAIGEEARDAAGVILEMIPNELQEALRAFVVSNLTRSEGPKAITFAWKPGDIDALEVYPGPCGYTVLVQIKGLSEV